MSDFKLDKHPKINSGFKVPDRYFETLTDEIAKRVDQDKAAKVIPIYARKATWLTAAAAIFAVALAIPFLQEDASKNEVLDDTAIENYISYQSNISQYDLVSLLEYSDIEQIESTLPVADETIEDILVTNNNLENYLID